MPKFVSPPSLKIVFCDEFDITGDKTYHLPHQKIIRGIAAEQYVGFYKWTAVHGTYKLKIYKTFELTNELIRYCRDYQSKSLLDLA